MFKKHANSLFFSWFIILFFFSKLKAFVWRPQIILKFLAFKYASKIHELKRNYPKGIWNTAVWREGFKIIFKDIFCWNMWLPYYFSISFFILISVFPFSLIKWRQVDILFWTLFLTYTEYGNVCCTCQFYSCYNSLRCFLIIPHEENNTAT